MIEFEVTFFFRSSWEGCSRFREDVVGLDCGRVVSCVSGIVLVALIGIKGGVRVREVLKVGL